MRGQHDATIERRDHHVHARCRAAPSRCTARARRRSSPRRRALRRAAPPSRRRHDDAEALVAQALMTRAPARRRRRRPDRTALAARQRSYRGCRARPAPAPRLRLGVREQTIERQREPRRGRAVDRRVPRGGERRRERGFLVEQLLGAVAHPARLDEQRRARSTAAGRAAGVRRSREPRQPRLHAVEGLRPPRAAPTARGPTAACCNSSRRARCTSSVGSSSRTGKIARRRRRRRSSAGRRPRTPTSRSTSSPHRSMRTGWSAVDGYTSTIEPRTATSPRPRPGTRAGSPCATSRSTSSSRSTWSPRRDDDRLDVFDVRAEPLHERAHRRDDRPRAARRHRRAGAR